MHDDVPFNTPLPQSYRPTPNAACSPLRALAFVPICHNSAANLYHQSASAVRTPSFAVAMNHRHMQRDHNPLVLKLEDHRHIQSTLSPRHATRHHCSSKL
ncbi:unnamed protein product [Ectocarpus sp. 4 AP-2014]